MMSFSSLQQALGAIEKSANDMVVCDLTGVEVRDAGISDVLFKLRKTQIRELILANCKIGKQGAIHLGTFLKYNKTVTRLYLQHNPDMGDEGIEELVKSIEKNKSLQVLNVANCGIGDIGAAAIAEHLSSSIQKLYLYDNKIGNLGAAALAEMIQSPNTGIQELFLWDNKIGDDGLEALEEAYETVKATNSGVGKIQLVAGLKNSNKGGKKPPVKRNFQLPKKDAPYVDTTQTGYTDLQSFARNLESGPVSPLPIPKPKMTLSSSPLRTNTAIRATTSVFESPQKPQTIQSPWLPRTKESIPIKSPLITHSDKHGIPLGINKLPARAAYRQEAENGDDDTGNYDEVTTDDEDDLHIAETEKLEAQIKALQRQIADV